MQVVYLGYLDNYKNQPGKNRTGLQPERKRLTVF